MYFGTRREVCLFVVMFTLTLSSGIAIGFWMHRDPVVPEAPRVPEVIIMMVAVPTNASTYSELWYSGGAGWPNTTFSPGIHNECAIVAIYIHAVLQGGEHTNLSIAVGSLSPLPHIIIERTRLISEYLDHGYHPVYTDGYNNTGLFVTSVDYAQVIFFMFDDVVVDLRVWYTPAITVQAGPVWTEEG